MVLDSPRRFTSGTLSAYSVQAGLSVVDAGPTVYTLPNFSAPTMVADESAQEVDLSYTNTDSWAGEVGGAMLLSLGRPQNPSINYFKGPYRYADKVAGAATPPTSPETITPPFPITEGQKVFGFVRVCRADGRLSEPFRLEAVVQA